MAVLTAASCYHSCDEMKTSTQRLCGVHQNIEHLFNTLTACLEWSSGTFLLRLWAVFLARFEFKLQNVQMGSLHLFLFSATSIILLCHALCAGPLIKMKGRGNWLLRLGLTSIWNDVVVEISIQFCLVLLNNIFYLSLY